MTNHETDLIDSFVDGLSGADCYFVIGHKLNSYEKYLYDKCRDKFEFFAIVPAVLSRYELKKLMDSGINVHISIEKSGMGIYKSFNYEIFERGNSILIALDGNSACTNLIQEAKNGKGKSKIFVAANSLPLKEKAESLKGYLTIFTKQDNILPAIRQTLREWKGQ